MLCISNTLLLLLLRNLEKLSAHSPASVAATVGCGFLCRISGDEFGSLSAKDTEVMSGERTDGPRYLREATVQDTLSCVDPMLILAYLQTFEIK